jgi:hypothetical protein
MSKSTREAKRTTADAVFGLLLRNLHTGGPGCTSYWGDYGAPVGRLDESDFMTMRVDGVDRIVLWNCDDKGLVMAAVCHVLPLVRLRRDFCGNVVGVETVDINVACNEVGVDIKKVRAVVPQI